MKCDAQIYEREKPFGKLEKTRKLTHKEIMGEELTTREKIGLELRCIRNEKGLTIYELGDACGLAFTTISKIENGRYNVSVDILGKVADALGCKLTFEVREGGR
jgi:DNA-binding XRE family transcriptional regulator